MGDDTTGRVRGSPRRRKKLVVLAARHPLPTIFADREQAEAGGLIRDTTPQRKPPWVSLATTPVPSGSPIAAITTGVVAVACLAAIAAGVPLVTMMSTGSATSSAARPANRSARPSAERYSIR